MSKGEGEEDGVREKGGKTMKNLRSPLPKGRRETRGGQCNKNIDVSIKWREEGERPNPPPHIPLVHPHPYDAMFDKNFRSIRVTVTKDAVTLTNPNFF